MTPLDLPRLVADGAVGWSFGCTRTGASHLREGKGCQDAYATWAGSAAGRPYLVAAVADGHGDARHDRSEVGASLAVRAAIAELTDLFLHFGREGRWTAVCQAFREDFPRRVGRRWRQAVEADTGDLAVASNTDPVEPYIRYGTTLLIVLAAGDSVLMAQIGDGDILLVRRDGDVERPIPPPRSEGGTSTDSMCSPDSHRLWRTAAVERAGGGLLLLASDGLVNAFPEEGQQWFRFARALGDRVAEFGPATVAGSLPVWLDHYSAVASGDDITLLAVALTPAVTTASEPGSGRQTSRPADSPETTVQVSAAVTPAGQGPAGGPAAAGPGELANE